MYSILVFILFVTSIMEIELFYIKNSSTNVYKLHLKSVFTTNSQTVKSIFYAIYIFLLVFIFCFAWYTYITYTCIMLKSFLKKTFNSILQWNIHMYNILQGIITDIALLDYRVSIVVCISVYVYLVSV